MKLSIYSYFFLFHHSPCNQQRRYLFLCGLHGGFNQSHFMFLIGQTCLRIQFTDIIQRLVTTFLFLCNTSPTLTDTCLTAPLVSKYCSLHHYHLTWVIRYIKRLPWTNKMGFLLIVALIILWCLFLFSLYAALKSSTEPVPPKNIGALVTMCIPISCYISTCPEPQLIIERHTVKTLDELLIKLFQLLAIWISTLCTFSARLIYWHHSYSQQFVDGFSSGIQLPL